MPDTLVLRYPLAGTDAAEWLAIDAAGARRAASGRGSLAEAAAAAAGHRLVVLVPGEQVSLASAALPGRSATRHAKLAPYALEEQLASDLETLHFAVGGATAAGVSVATVERTTLAAWLGALTAAGLAPAALLPDALALPDNPGHVVLALEGRRLLLRRPGQLPVVLDAEPLATVFEVAGLVDPALHLLVYASAADHARALVALESLRDRVASLQVQLLPDGLLALLAPGAAAGRAPDLLQGEYATRDGLAGEWPRWRLAAGLAAGFLLAHLAALGVDLVRLQHAERGLDEELRAAAAQALPNVHNLARLPNLRAAVESRVRATRDAVNGGLVGTLGVLASATGAAPGLHIDTLSYRQGVTDLTLDAPDVGSLDRIRESAQGRGYQAEIQGATQHDSRTQGRLQLRGPGS